MYISSRNNWILINPNTILELIQVVQVDYCRQHTEDRVLSFMSLGWIQLCHLATIECWRHSQGALDSWIYCVITAVLMIHWAPVKCSVPWVTHPRTAYGNTEWYNSVEGNFKCVHANHTYIYLLAHHVLQWFFRGLRLNAKALFALVSIEKKKSCISNSRKLGDTKHLYSVVKRMSFSVTWHRNVFKKRKVDSKV